MWFGRFVNSQAREKVPAHLERRRSVLSAFLHVRQREANLADDIEGDLSSGHTDFHFRRCGMLPSSALREPPPASLPLWRLKDNELDLLRRTRAGGRRPMKVISRRRITGASISRAIKRLPAAIGRDSLAF